MKYTKQYAIIGLLLALTLHLPANGQTASPVKTNELVSIKAAYDTARLRIETECEQRKTNTLAVYGKALADSTQTLKRQGDLDAYLAVQAAQKTFLAQKTVPAITDCNAAVAPCVAQYNASIAEAGDQRDKKLANLQRQYATRMEALTKDFMLQNRIEDAKQAQAEVKRIRAELADSASTATPGPDPAEPKTHTPTETGPTEIKHSVLFTTKRLAARDDSVTAKEMTPFETYHDASGTTWNQLAEVRFLYVSQTIEVSVRNIGSAADSFAVECLFFQQDAANDKTSLADRKKTEVELKPDEVKVLTFKSPVLKSSIDKVFVEHKMQHTGNKLYGYIVALSDGNGAFKAAASRELESLSKDKACLAEILKKGSLPENAGTSNRGTGFH